VNINLAGVPLITSILVQNAKTPNDPALRWENMTLLARYVQHVRQYYGGFTSLKQFMEMVISPMEAAMAAFAINPTGDASGRSSEKMEFRLPPVKGLALNEKSLKDSVVVGGPRRVWKLVAKAEVGRIHKRITAVWDMKHVSMQARRYNMGPGGFLYWREE